MAPAKETSVELCKRVNAQGNTIAIRMLEYLSMAKSPIHGFEALSRDFVELCQELWSIEAGVTEATKSRNAFPVEVSQELDKRLRQVTEEFLVLSQMVNKFVDKENHKGGFGMKFRMMFADTDVDKMRHTLARSRDALKVSSAMFRWSLGDAKADASMGIGYAGLIAALERLSPTKAASLPSIHSAPTSSLPPTPHAKAGSYHGTQASAPNSQGLQRPSVNELRYGEGQSYENEISQYRPVETGLSSGIVDLHKTGDQRLVLVRANQQGKRSITTMSAIRKIHYTRKSHHRILVAHRPWRRSSTALVFTSATWTSITLHTRLTLP
ncbi:hypothetical protein P3342_001854 [Pyrenophora teres f. teres]|nr:hypothetical protein P3342_001854 [Pyrenophora teres f. teres]